MSTYVSRSHSNCTSSTPTFSLSSESQAQLSRSAQVLENLPNNLHVCILRIMQNSRNRSYCVGDFSSRLVRNTHQTPHNVAEIHLAEIRVHRRFLITRVTEVQRWRTSMAACVLRTTWPSRQQPIVLEAARWVVAAVLRRLSPRRPFNPTPRKHTMFCAAFAVDMCSRKRSALRM